MSGPSFQELLAAELRLDPRQWEEAPRRHEDRPVSNFSTPAASAVTQRHEALLEIDCLVSYCCVYTTFNMITTALYSSSRTVHCITNTCIYTCTFSALELSMKMYIGCAINVRYMRIGWWVHQLESSLPHTHPHSLLRRSIGYYSHHVTTLLPNTGRGSPFCAYARPRNQTLQLSQPRG